MNSEKRFTLSLDNWINDVKKLLSMDSYYEYVCKRILSTDSRLHCLWGICLVKQTKWITLILKSKQEKHECSVICESLIDCNFGKEAQFTFALKPALAHGVEVVFVSLTSAIYERLAFLVFAVVVIPNKSCFTRINSLWKLTVSRKTVCNEKIF